MSKKIITILTAVIFLTGIVCDFSGRACAKPGNHVWQNKRVFKTLNLNSLNNNPDSAFFELGTIGRIYTPENKNPANPVIFLIQDIHCNYGAQKNIARLVNLLAQDYGIDTICAEGGSGEIFGREYDRLPDMKLKTTIADYFVRQGWFSGTEFARITNPSINLFGIDDKDLYQENRQGILDIIGRTQEVLDIINEIEFRLNSIKERYFSTAQKEWDNIIKQAAADQLSYLDLVLETEKRLSAPDKHLFPNLNKFKDILEKGGKIDAKTAEKELTEFLSSISCAEQLTMEELNVIKNGVRTKKYWEMVTRLITANPQYAADYPNLSAYLKTMQTYETMNSGDLIREVYQAEAYAWQNLLAGEKDNANKQVIADAVQSARIMAIIMELTTAKLPYYKYNMVKNMNFLSELAKCISLLEQNNRQNLNIPEKTQSLLLTSIQNSLSFYSIAIKRNAPITKNTLDLLQKEEKPYGILVCGGFHADGISNMLEDENISYITFTPHISAEDESSKYINAMRGALPPVEQIAAAIMPNLVPPPVGSPETGHKFRGTYNVLSSAKGAYSQAHKKILSPTREILGNLMTISNMADSFQLNADNPKLAPFIRAILERIKSSITHTIGTIQFATANIGPDMSNVYAFQGDQLSQHLVAYFQENEVILMEKFYNYLKGKQPDGAKALSGLLGHELCELIVRQWINKKEFAFAKKINNFYALINVMLNELVTDPDSKLQGVPREKVYEYKKFLIADAIAERFEKHIAGDTLDDLIVDFFRQEVQKRPAVPPAGTKPIPPAPSGKPAIPQTSPTEAVSRIISQMPEIQGILDKFYHHPLAFRTMSEMERFMEFLERVKQTAGIDQAQALNAINTHMNAEITIAVLPTAPEITLPTEQEMLTAYQAITGTKFNQEPYRKSYQERFDTLQMTLQKSKDKGRISAAEYRANLAYAENNIWFDIINDALLTARQQSEGIGIICTQIVAIVIGFSDNHDIDGKLLENFADQETLKTSFKCIFFGMLCPRYPKVFGENAEEHLDSYRRIIYKQQEYKRLEPLLRQRKDNLAINVYKLFHGYNPALEGFSGDIGDILSCEPMWLLRTSYAVLNNIDLNIPKGLSHAHKYAAAQSDIRNSVFNIIATLVDNPSQVAQVRQALQELLAHPDKPKEIVLKFASYSPGSRRPLEDEEKEPDEVAQIVNGGIGSKLKQTTGSIISGPFQMMQTRVANIMTVFEPAGQFIEENRYFYQLRYILMTALSLYETIQPHTQGLSSNLPKDLSRARENEWDIFDRALLDILIKEQDAIKTKLRQTAREFKLSPDKIDYLTLRTVFLTDSRSDWPPDLDWIVGRIPQSDTREHGASDTQAFSQPPLIPSVREQLGSQIANLLNAGTNG